MAESHRALDLGAPPMAIPPPVLTGPPAAGFPNVRKPGDQATVEPTYTTTTGGGGGGGGTGGGSGGGGTGGGSGGPDASVDWATAFFTALGITDTAMQTKIANIFKSHAEDQGLAQTLATQYIRTTDWYQIHYPGALEGIAKGVIGSEADYARYLNQINVLSRQYQGRDISGDEIKGYLGAGYDPSYVSNLYAGQAWVKANTSESQYLAGAFGTGQLNQDQLTALGNENAGIDSAQGQTITTMLKQATDRFRGMFQGTLATPQIALGANGLEAPSLLGGKSSTAPDIGA